MSYTYNLYNLEAPFKEYLLAGNQKPVSVRNYLSDIRHFFGWITLYLKSNNFVAGEKTSPLQKLVTSNSISEYKSYLESNNIPHKTINRRLSTIRKFCSFCISQGWMKENPAKKISNISIKTVFVQRQSLNKALISPELDKASGLKSLFKNVFNRLVSTQSGDKRRGDDKQPNTYPLTPNSF